MEYVTRVQILDEAVYVSLCANALRKGMNPYVLFPVIDKWLDRLDCLVLIKQKSLRITEFKPTLLHLKADFVSHPAHGIG